VQALRHRSPAAADSGLAAVGAVDVDVSEGGYISGADQVVAAVVVSAAVVVVAAAVGLDAQTELELELELQRDLKDKNLIPTWKTSPISMQLSICIVKRREST
jgi:hypothetical protein